MKTLEPSDTFGDTVFCDEIRQEANGKLLYLGVYVAHMRVPGKFPFLLPRLGLAISYWQRPNQFVMPIRFAVFLPGDSDDKPSIETDVPDESAKVALENAKKMMSSQIDPNNCFATVHANFNFTNLMIPQPGSLKVRAVRGDTLVRLGSMVIEPAPNQGK